MCLAVAVQRPAPRFALAVAVFIAGGAAVLAGCGQPSEPATSQQLAVCVSPTDTLPTGKQVDLEMRQGATVVAAGSVPVGAVYLAEVPIGTDIDVYADGELVGTGGSSIGNEADTGGPPVYMRGPGCPASPVG